MTPERKNGDPMKHLLDKRSKQNFFSNSVFFFSSIVYASRQLSSTTHVSKTKEIDTEEVNTT